jgi:hypothetical protein
MKLETISFKQFLARPTYVLGTVTLAMIVFMTWICPFTGLHALIFIWLLHKAWKGTGTENENE